MATFLYAWEIGGGLGHVLPALPVLRRLLARGHRVVAALRYPDSGAALSDAGVETHPAPWRRTTARDPEFRDAIVTPETWAEDLLGRGYFHSTDLRKLLGDWLDLCVRTRPDALVADFAPTALLAARGLGIPAANFGTGFAAPPRASPIPTTLPWAKVDPERLRRSEARALDTVNAALRTFGRAPLATLGDLYADAVDVVATWPELDHYPQRPLTRYWGPVFSERGGETPVWPPGDGARAFVYLKPDFEAFDALFAALGAHGCRALVYAGGRAFPEAPPFIVAAQRPLAMDATLADCDFVVCHAGHGTVAQALAAGRPLLALPGHYEQALTARNIERLGVGVRLPRGGRSAQALAEALASLCRDPAYAAAAQAFAGRYAHVSQEETLAALVDALERLPRKAHATGDAAA